MPIRKPKIFFTIFLSLLAFVSVAQPTWTLDPFGKEKKPVQYEEKKLASEKTGDKKFTRFRRIIQNNTTHYNFYFNANNKIKAVIERAKLSQKDDYTQLLSFFPFSLENTAVQKTELDSVIYKATAGILLHDLRSDWVDNMYLLIGKSYYLQKKFDSAALTFQFINYNLFPRGKKDDDDHIVGTNDASGSGALSIANKEKRNIIQKVLTIPPSRNDALIWLTRTFIEQGEYGDAAGMINILQHDQNLPPRLTNDLEEVMSYWFFAQNSFDSSAYHLEKALSNADSKEDKSRWEFLLAQLYEEKGNYDQASVYYDKVSKHTTNPVMDIYARLNDAKMMRNNGNTTALNNSIGTLLKMARRDKYESYRDIIYYSTGQLTLQIPDTSNAEGMYLKSIRYTSTASAYRDKSFLKLGDIAYSQKRYLDAHNYYDSLDLTDKKLADKVSDITERKETLRKIVLHIIAINRQDSLQVIAALAPADRDALLKKLVKKYRREMGMKAEDNSTGVTPISFSNSNAAPVDLFTNNSKGEWYFYNSSLRSRGVSEFKSKWGKRTNVDNWRRRSAIESNALVSQVPSGTFDDPDLAKPLTPFGTLTEGGNTIVKNSYDALLADIPLTTEKMDSSNKVIAVNMLALAKLFQNELFDYDEAISNYTQYLERFAGSENDAEAYLGLYYCYSKLGNNGKAAYYKNIVTSKYSASGSAIKLLNPSLLEPNKKNPEVTQRYEGIYNMFIEGNFEAAINAKKLADSVHGSNYWTPQLLYIESMYYIKERKDSNAIATLNNLQELYPSSPLHDKASTMIDVLSRRDSIEKYLTNLEVTRAEEDKAIFVDESNATPGVPVQKPAEPKTVIIKPAVKPGILRDSIIKVPDQYVSGSFVFKADQPHYVTMILDKVDGVYINEAKNAFNRYNKESYYTQNLVITRDAIDAEKTLLLFGPFEDAAAAEKYFDKVKKAAPTEVSWLQATKYSFLIISESNLQVLKTTKDLPAYKKLLNANLGNKF